ncbi:hypothetical protein [uncultured Kriegella sp.]|uniref:hypothetical protein n=1 Tax=uncultured Kriegella sp. TaxID=1798910 RepID=UPI0030D9D012|tara:strand:- start:114848 stop:119071 length:4224 start_codon:yes stop_codon:yes gene_type:complete
MLTYTSTSGNLTNNSNIEIYPNGVKLLDNKVHLHFKAIITIHPSTNLEDKINCKNFEEIRDRINTQVLWYELRSNEIKFDLNKNAFGENVNPYIVDKFELTDIISRTSTFYNNFQFGRHLKNQQLFCSFKDFLGKEEYTLIGDRLGSEDGPISQYEEIEDKNAKSDYDNKLFEEKTGDDILKKNNSDSNEKMNFTILYNHILDHPIVAEAYYGVIRSFYIPINTIENVFESKQKYKISLPLPENNVGNTNSDCEIDGREEFPFLYFKIGEKFYNGLFTPFLANDHLKKTYIDQFDSYKSELDSNSKNIKSNPEGFFLKGIYHTTEGGTQENTIDKKRDPFECKEYRCGFNVISSSLRPEEGEPNQPLFNSLSIHRDIVTLVKEGGIDFSVLTSGIMYPKSDIVIGNKATRTNLFARWNGNNLLVNRNVEKRETPKKLDKSNLEYYDETIFIEEKCFKTKQTYVPGGNVQLLNSLKYAFYLRYVMPTGYYIPIKKELKLVDETQVNYMITVEDIFGAKEIFDNENHIDWNNSFGGKKYQLNKPSILAPTIIGRKCYENAGSRFVDGHTHFVIDATRNEKKETRIIYPPVIKFQDFKFEGNLSKEMLNYKDAKEFAKDCMQLEKRSGEKPKTCQNLNYKVQYLADLRASDLVIYPGDLKTTNSLNYWEKENTFKFSSNYPYYTKTRGKKLKVKKQADTYHLLFEGDEVFKKGLGKGQHVFYLKSNRLNSKVLSGPTKIEVSIVDYPDTPKAKREFIEEVIDNTKIKRRYENLNEWSFEFKLETNVNENSYEDISMFSIKYLQEAYSLKLREDNLKQLKREYINSEILGCKQVNRYDDDLLNDEYPYEMFLQKEGSVTSDSGLVPTVYPKEYKLSFKLPSKHIENNELVFQMEIANETRVKVGYANNGETGPILRIHLNKETLIDLDKDLEVEIHIFFDIIINLFKLKIIQGSEEKILELPELVYPYLNLESVKISDELEFSELEFMENSFITDGFVPGSESTGFLSMILSENDEHFIDFSRSAEHIVIGQEQNPFAVERRIRLFASSAMQAFFRDPEEDLKEFDIGTKGSILCLSIPNNVKPTTPKVETDILLLSELDDRWRDKDSKFIKEHYTQQLLRITMERDFMREGKNKLGIILSKIDENCNHMIDDDVSAIGEDITKLNEKDSWSTNNLKEYLNVNSNYEELKKYFGNTEIHLINGEEYEILHCNPFYNTSIKKWQVILPFKKLEQKETAFIRLSVLKIANGLYEDEKTTYSNITEPIITPIYNSKRFGLQKLRGAERKTFKVYNSSTSTYEGKLMAILVSNRRSKKELYNISTDSSDLLTDYHEFKSLDIENTGKALLTKKREVKIQAINGKFVEVYEFETHQNENLGEFIDISLGQVFIDLNPLFDERIKGLRLIHMDRFKI